MDLKIIDTGDNTVAKLFNDWCDKVKMVDSEEPPAFPSAAECADTLFESGIISEEQRDELKSKLSGHVLTEIEIEDVESNMTICEGVPCLCLSESQCVGCLGPYANQTNHKILDLERNNV